MTNAIRNARIVLGLTAVSLSCGPVGSVRLQTKNMQQEGNHMNVRGHWRLIQGPLVHSTENAVVVWCSKSEASCTETRAELYVKHPQLGTYLMTAGPEMYRVLSWSEDTVVASREARAADVLLRISLRDRFAEKTIRETRSRGADADPNVESKYVLE